MAIPTAEPPRRPQFVFIVGSELLRETGEKTRKNEDLGVKTIKGIEFVGARTTTMMVEQPSRIAVDERWISRDLGLIGAMLQSSPSWKTTVEIQDVVRNDPDARLFVVPPEYTIEDFAIPDPPK